MSSAPEQRLYVHVRDMVCLVKCSSNSKVSAIKFNIFIKKNVFLNLPADIFYPEYLKVLESKLTYWYGGTV